MSINTISSPINRLYTAYDSAASSRVSASSKASVTLSGGDSTVTISDAAWQALDTDELTAANGGKTQAQVQKEMEVYAIPNWYNDFLMGAPAGPTGQIDEKALAEKYPQAAGASPQLIGEYDTKVLEHIHAVVAANGLAGPENQAAFHQAMIVDKQSSERIRQELIANIKQDPDMMRLMKQLGMTGALEAGRLA